MSQTLDNGIVVPINADAWNLAPDLQTMGNTAKVVTPVNGTTARDLLTVSLGRLCWRTDVNRLEFWDGAAWMPFEGQEASANISTFGSGFTALGTAGHTPRVRRSGNCVHLFGAVQSSGTSTLGNVLTIPTAFRPPSTDTRFIGAGVASSGNYYELVMAGGVVSIGVGYNNLTITAVQTLPLNAFWWLD